MDMDCVGDCFTDRVDSFCANLLVPANATLVVTFDAERGAADAAQQQRRLRVRFDVSPSSDLDLLSVEVFSGEDGALPGVELITIWQRPHAGAGWLPVAPTASSPARIGAGAAIEAEVLVSMAPFFGNGGPFLGVVGEGTVRVSGRRRSRALGAP